MHQFVIKFEVPEPYVDASTFVASVQAGQNAVSVLGGILLGDEDAFELVVLPPSGGSLREFLGVLYKGTSKSLQVLGLVALVDSPTGQVLMEELTGKPLHEHVREALRGSKVNGGDDGGISTAPAEIDELAVQNAIEEIVADSTSHILSLPREGINRLPIHANAKYELASSQSVFFEALANDPRVGAVDFENAPAEPINRNDFAERAVRPSPPAEDDASVWSVSIEGIQVTSPNFDQTDQYNRKWKGRREARGVCHFVIENEAFWSDLREEKITFTDRTYLKVQLASEYVSGRLSRLIVLQVLEIDRSKYADPLDDAALRAILGNFSPADERGNQGDLFDLPNG